MVTRWDKQNYWTDHFDINGLDDTSEADAVVEAAQNIYRQSLDQTAVIDFDDTILMPLIKNLRVILSRSGNVAWFSCLLDDWGEWAGEPWHWKDTRWTGVLQKTDGKWVMMQQHFSMAEDAVRAQVMEEINIDFLI